MTIRAIEHIGITVPDLEQATTFFADAFGAEKIYDMIDAPLSGPGIESGLGVPQGATIEAIRMLRLGNGPNLELFVYSGVGQREPVLPNDFGIQHFCVYVDDIDAAATRLEKAGANAAQRAGRATRRRRRPGKPISVRPHAMGQHGRAGHISVPAGIRGPHRITPLASANHRHRRLPTAGIMNPRKLNQRVHPTGKHLSLHNDVTTVRRTLEAGTTCLR